MPSVFESVLTALLDEGKVVRFRASGISMAPAIRDGDEVLVEKSASLRRGDVVLFREPRSQRLLAHRIISIAGDGILMLRGDAAEGCEGPVARSQVLGRVIGVERDGVSRPLNGLALRLHLIARRLRMALFR